MKTQISIIIPVYNDPEGLRDTVQSLIPQVNGISEIIISDNNSTDKTSQVGIRYAGHPNISYIEANELQSSYYARNQGIEQSTGDILIFIDANVKVEEGFITSVHRTMNETDCDYMGCNIEIIDMESSVGLYNAATAFPVKKQISQFSFSPTCCLVVTRELIDDIGNFDERLISGGDLEFGVRANNSGYQLHFQPDITVYHPARNRLSQLVSKQIRINYGFCQLAKYHPEHFSDASQIHIKDMLPVHPVALSNRAQMDPGSMPMFLLWICYASIIKIFGNLGKIRYRLRSD